ncbi:MAG: PD40 domain-containing protein [Acidobacteria bacterium]|nr:PD40 domain-containing protein [Acidobacteriota bacterium]
MKVNWWVPAGVFIAIGLAYVMPAVKLWMKNAPPPPVPRQLTTETGMNAHPSFSPDASAVVYSSNRGGRFELFVKPVSGGPDRALTSDGHENVEPAWSPDGKWIAYRSHHGGLFVIAAAGGEPRKVAASGTSPSWWPDSSRVVFSDQGRLWSSALAGGDAEPITKAGEPEGEHVAPHFSADKKHLGFICGKRMWELNVESKQLIQVTEGDPAPTSFVYAADGLTVYFFASASKKAQGMYRLTRDSATRKAKAAPDAVSEGEGATLQDLEIDAGGKRLAYTMVTGPAEKLLGNVFVAELPAAVN